MASGWDPESGTERRTVRQEDAGDPGAAAEQRGSTGATGYSSFRSLPNIFFLLLVLGILPCHLSLLFLIRVLKVVETVLKKKMEQVKELFDSRTEVFRELLSVRAHLLQRIDTCQTSIQRIHSSVRMLCPDSKDLLQQHLQVVEFMHTFLVSGYIEFDFGFDLIRLLHSVKS